MEARMTNPAMVLGAMEPFQALFKAVYAGGVDPATLELVHLRASQINGCSACVDSGARSARKAGETDALGKTRDLPLQHARHRSIRVRKYGRHGRPCTHDGRVHLDRAISSADSRPLRKTRSIKRC